MAKRWKKEEITYLRRYAKSRTLLELTERFRIEAEQVEAKLAELGLKTVDGIGAVNLAEDPAVKLYERGVRAVHAKKWTEAKKLLERVVEEGDMVDLVHRARQYLELVERESKAAGDPRDPYVKAVLDHNAGNLDAAEAACTREGRMEKDDRFAYLAAAIAAVREDYAAALERLRVAVELNPRNLIQARQDVDFEELREQPEFDEQFA
jgi:tetratricopeptide (TPR) repeat protein